MIFLQYLVPALLVALMIAFPLVVWKIIHDT